MGKHSKEAEESNSCQTLPFPVRKSWTEEARMSVEREAGWPTQRLRSCFRSHSGCRVKKNIGKLVREVAILYSQAPLHQTAGLVSENGSGKGYTKCQSRGFLFQKDKLKS